MRSRIRWGSNETADSAVATARIEGTTDKLVLKPCRRVHRRIEAMAAGNGGRCFQLSGLRGR